MRLVLELEDGSDSNRVFGKFTVPLSLSRQHLQATTPPNTQRPQRTQPSTLQPDFHTRTRLHGPNITLSQLLIA